MIQNDVHTSIRSSTTQSVSNALQQLSDIEVVGIMAGSVEWWIELPSKLLCCEGRSTESGHVGRHIIEALHRGEHGRHCGSGKRN